MSKQDNSDLKLLFETNLQEECVFLNKSDVGIWAENMFAWLFCVQESCIDFTLFQQKELDLKLKLKGFLEKTNVIDANAITLSFFEDLFEIHKKLLSDLNAVLEFDPAAKSRTEVLLAYPGFFTIVVYRLANNLWNKNISVLPRVLSEYAHSKTGIDIHPAATIGERFFIDHGTGIVIGETTKVGNDVKIYQGVTLGALSVSKDKATQKRHPTIEDNVIIYANATILGGNTSIGKGSVIGGNVWITESILPDSLVYHKSEIIVKTKIEYQDIIDFSI